MGLFLPSPEDWASVSFHVPDRWFKDQITCQRQSPNKISLRDRLWTTVSASFIPRIRPVYQSKHWHDVTALCSLLWSFLYSIIETDTTQSLPSRWSAGACKLSSLFLCRDIKFQGNRLTTVAITPCWIYRCMTKFTRIPWWPLSSIPPQQIHSLNLYPTWRQ